MALVFQLEFLHFCFWFLAVVSDTNLIIVVSYRIKLSKAHRQIRLIGLK